MAGLSAHPPKGHWPVDCLFLACLLLIYGLFVIQPFVAAARVIRFKWCFLFVQRVRFFALSTD